MECVIPEKIETRGTYFSEPSWNFRFVLLTLEILEHFTAFPITPEHLAKLCYTTWKFQDQKQGPLEFCVDFLERPWRFFFFLIDHWNFHKLFLQYPLITASLWSFNFKFLVDIEKVLNFGRKTRHCVCYIFPNSDLVLIFSDYLSLIKSFRNSWSGNCKEQIRINSACKCCNIFWKYNAGKILKLSSGEIANYIATPSYI